jgi:gag-polyprotein putative aspartyl protease/PDZ domain
VRDGAGCGLGWTIAAVTLALVALPTCGGGGGDGIRIMGTIGVPSPALVGANVVIIDAQLNGHPGGRLLVDTGSPVTLVNPAEFPGASLPQQAQVIIDVGIGPVTVDHVPALQLVGGMMDLLRLAGILGGNVLRDFSTSFDYRGQQFWLGAGASIADVAIPGASVPFNLEGGGLARLTPQQTIVLAATRVSVTVDLEGVQHPFIVDTGASEMTVRSSLFQALRSDGRVAVAGFPVSTAAGSVSATVTRTRNVTVAGETVTNVATLDLGDDTLLDTLQMEVKHQVDGLLGGTFLREFLVTIDYPGRTLHLQRYATRAHIVDELQRVGLSLGAHTSAGYVIFSVYAASGAAAAGIASGDELVAVDGHSLADLDAMAADQLLVGVPGTARRLAFGIAANPALAGAEVTVSVDDLVPAP